MPADVTGEELDAAARTELRTLPSDLAERVARQLVMAGRLLDDDPEQAYRHAKEARRLASRVGIVREAAGYAAYHAGEWSEALAELRAARRLPGRESMYLPIMADCERGLGRPERALDIARSPEAASLSQDERVELRIVESGARRDLGQHAAAVVTLQIPELRERVLRPWSARLFYAYADALVDADRDDEAREWFARAAAADRDGDTDAAERYAELEGLEIIDTEDFETPGEDPGATAETQARPRSDQGSPAGAATLPAPTGTGGQDDGSATGALVPGAGTGTSEDGPAVSGTLPGLGAVAPNEDATAEPGSGAPHEGSETAESVPGHGAGASDDGTATAGSGDARVPNDAAGSASSGGTRAPDGGSGSGATGSADRAVTPADGRADAPESDGGTEASRGEAAEGGTGSAEGARSRPGGVPGVTFSAPDEVRPVSPGEAVPKVEFSAPEPGDDEPEK